MKKFVTDNLAIVAAIVLPLVLVAVLAVSKLFVSRMVEDPQYDFLVATSFYGGAAEAFSFDVVRNRLEIAYTFPAQGDGAPPRDNRTRLWRVRVPSMTVEEIALVPPSRGPDAAGGQRVVLEIPGISGLRMLSTQPSPDGYEFQPSYGSYGGNIMRELFAPRGRGNGPVPAIVKDGRALPVRYLGGGPYDPYNVRFLGWIADAPANP